MSSPFSVPDYLPGRSVVSVLRTIQLSNCRLHSVVPVLPGSNFAVWHLGGLTHLKIAFCLLTQSGKNILHFFRWLNEPKAFTPSGSYFGSFDVPSFWVGLKHFRFQLRIFICFHIFRAAFYRSPDVTNIRIKTIRVKFFSKVYIRHVLTMVINNC